VQTGAHMQPPHPGLDLTYVWGWLSLPTRMDGWIGWLRLQSPISNVKPVECWLFAQALVQCAIYVLCFMFYVWWFDVWRQHAHLPSDLRSIWKSMPTNKITRSIIEWQGNRPINYGSQHRKRN
jgi:hypothetical protein